MQYSPPAVLLLCLLFLSSPCSAAGVSEVGTEAGSYAPPFTLTDISGRAVSLESLRGQVVLLNFWSMLCAPCMAEMPSLNRLFLTLKDKGLQVIAVSIDPSDKPVRDYVAKNNIAFPVLLDTGKEVYGKAYAGPALPATYLIDRNGIIVENFSGLEVWDAPEMMKRVQMLLGQK